MKKIIILLLTFFMSINCFTISLASQVSFKKGDSNDEIMNLQDKLIILNYLNVEATGKFGLETKKAVEKFQKDNNLNITGIIDDQTIKLLEKAPYREIKTGTKSLAVKKIQSRLFDMGFLNVKPNGNYGNKTINAIKSFQMKIGIEVTGKLDSITQEKIYDDSLQSDNQAIVSDGRSNTSKYIPFDRKLFRGINGNDVKKVQEKLKNLGFYDDAITGYYMNKTIEAVKKFQSYNSLDIDGVTDSLTWDKMFNSNSIVDAMSTPAPTLEPVIPKYNITVDVTNQAVLVYEKDENDDYTKLVKKMICSTGTKSTPSDVGDWVYNGRKARWCYFPAYGSHAQYWTRINDYIAFHSVIYNQVDEMALSVKSYNNLGKRASHGCIRLMVDDAKWIYDNLEKGSLITITESRQPDEELKESIKKPPLNKNNMKPFPTEMPTPEPVYSAKETIPFDIKELSKKDEGIDVFWLQSALKYKGYYEGTITGKFLSGTENAVKQFQEENKLKKTGKADIETLDLLYKDTNYNRTLEPLNIVTPSPAP